MAQQLTEILNYFLNDYIQKKNVPFGKGAEVYKSICVSACDKIYETGLVNKEDYKVEGSVGQGNWAKVPWLAIFRKDITLSAQNGVYIVYLLSSDGNSLYLTLNQGVTDAGKDSTTKETIKALRNNADRISAQLNKHSFLSDENINLGNDITDLGKKYQKGTIFYKKYSKHDVPSEDILREDLKKMLDIYEEYYDKVYKGNSTPSPKLPPVPAEVNMTKQKIFFGAPGTGKSFKVDEIVQNQQVFRTTFHPDYDYAQFVGAYKPKEIQHNDNGLLSEEQLAKKLFDFFTQNVNGEIDRTTAITLFGFKYANSLNGKNMNEIVRLSGIGEERYKSAYLLPAVKARLCISEFDKKLTYSFVPQVFAKAYAAAWKQYFAAGNVSTADNQVYLVIEEINRGNCAQIFGDIFQLLDRDSEGFSQYSIDADCDFATWLKEDSILKTVWSEYETKVGDGKLKLPPNLNILATMNTSDQSLFPMDSAFKRRFDWEYVPINYEKAEADFIVSDTSFNFKWLDFLKKVNADIYKVTQSEDKQMGEFFIKPKNKDYITLDEFRSKVLFYLWDSVYKDELDSKLVFHFAYPEKGPDVTFQRLFNSDFVEILKKMLANLDDKYKDGAQQE